MTSTPVRPEDVTRYVPAFVARRLAADPALRLAPYCDEFPAAALFADISGFTALSERLAGRGPAGVEQLTQLLNAYFSRLIDVVADHGGDVIKFAGDALLAWWPAAPEQLPALTQLAAQCALAIQAALQSFAATISERLSLRIGVGAGQAFAFSVGGVRDRWEFIGTGPAVSEATLASPRGQPGEVVLGPCAWKLLPPGCRGAELAPGYTRLECVPAPAAPRPLRSPTLPAAAVPALLSYIPAAIHLRLAARQSDWLAELRRLTVLFLNLPGLGYTTPLAKAEAVMQALQQELYRYEGSVNKLSVDEKGVTLVAALGLPPLGHEDDGLRGVLAGLHMQARLQQLGWPSSVGVTSGQVFCGVIGSDRRCEYTIIGDVVNLSARLMQAAHGGILCDEATYEAAGGHLQCEALPAIKVKGKAHPIPVFRPVHQARAAGVPDHQLPMVGRVEEQQRLRQILQRLAAERTAGVLIIEGDAGVGKSRLLAKLLEVAQPLGLTTMVGAAQAIERSTPYYAWRPICRQLLGLKPSGTDPEQCRRRVLAALASDPDLVPLAPLLDVVLALDLGDNATTAPMFGEARIGNTNEILVRLLKRRTADGPLQVVVEDCHWLDSASWALARQVAQEIPALLVLVTRPLPEPVPREYSLLAAAPNTERLTLGPLPPEESLLLAARRLGVDRLPDSVAALLRAKAQGNPFFLEQLALALRDSGKIRIRDGKCLVEPGGDLDALRFPDTVQGVVTSRIDRLPAPEQLTLKVASVIGRNFTQHILCDLYPIDEARPHQAQHLEALAQHQLVQLDAPHTDPAYSFKHVITQEVAYQLMPPAQRKALHQRAAEWYEGHHQADLTPFFPLLARHWSQTDQVARALDYLEKSGRNALRNYANDEAVAFFGQALALDGRAATHSDSVRRAGWQRRLAEAYYNLGSLGESLEHFQSALDLLGYPFPQSGWGMVLGCLWEMAKQVTHRLWPARFLGRARDQAVRVQEAARAYERLAEIRYMNDAKLPAIHAALRDLNLAETLGTCPELARSYANAAIVMGVLMMHGAARAYARRAQRTAEAVDQFACTAYVAFIRTVYWVTVGEWEEAERDATRAIAIAKQTGERRRWYESMTALAHVMSRKGDLRRAAELAREVHEAGRRRAMPQIQVWGLAWHLWCLLALEPSSPQVRGLETALAECLEAHADIPLADQVLGYGPLALAYWRRGEEPLARKAAAAAEAVIAQTSQVSHYVLLAYTSLAEVYLGLHEAHPALRQEMTGRTRRLSRLLNGFSLMYPVGWPSAWLVRGWYDWMRGRPSRARRAWRKSLAAGERYRMPYEQAQAHYELGRRCEVGDPAGQAHLGRARELFLQVGVREDRAG